MGYKFVEKTSSYVGITVGGSKDAPVEKYTILAEFPFDSTRKRMTLIVEEQNTKKILVMTKGADSIMIPRTTLPDKERKIIDDHLYKFACTGLRTLVMGQKEISKGEFDKWNKKFNTVNTSNDEDKDA